MQLKTNKYFLKPLILSLGLIFFTMNCTITPQHHRPFDEGAHYIGQVLKRTNKACTKRHKMSAGGFGNEAMYKIKGLTLLFNMDRQLSKDEIREVLVDCAHEMIKNVHECEGIQKYLLPEGFSEKNVRVIIALRDKRKTIVHPNICVASFNKGKIDYSTQSIDDEFNYKETTEETYQEAIAILQSQGKLEFKERSSLRELKEGFSLSRRDSVCVMKRMIGTIKRVVFVLIHDLDHVIIDTIQSFKIT